MHLKRKRKINYAVLFMALLGVVFLFIFNYLPMFGIAMAFKDMDYALDITRALKTSDYVGLDNFKAFLQDKDFLEIMVNTLGLNTLQLIISFPIPIIFAILLNEIHNKKFQKTVLTISYVPYFISWVVFGGILIGMLSPDGGVINEILLRTGIVDEPISFMSNPEYFWAIVIISSIIKGLGWGAIIYISAIAGIDKALYEAAEIDGVNRFQKALYITLPLIKNTMLVCITLCIAGNMKAFDNIWVMTSGGPGTASMVMAMYGYQISFNQSNMGYGSAISIGILIASSLIRKATQTLSGA